MKNFVPIVSHSLKYNPSIDGLRGIAISLVLLFHIWPNYFSFGYVGVDIFFVLSGYLITQIIYTKLESNNFSIIEFYRNRIRRIFPALIVVLTFTLIFGYLFMFPSELKNLAQHIKSSAFFYENFRLISEVGYWDEAAILKPLLHFWSLAIEEQFYIFWPLIFIFIYKTRVNIVLATIILFLILFTLANVLDIDKFYHTISRSWELAIGGLVFVASYKYKKLVEFLNKYKILIYVTFFVAISFSYKNTSFDIFKTFLVVFASAILILSISYDKTKTIFANQVLVFIGIISFPLYLWHYVIISFSHIIGYDIEKIGIYIIILSILFSYITYRYIELYARAKNSYLFVVILLLIVICIGVISQFINKYNGLENRIHLSNTNKEFQKQFVRTPAQNDLGVSLISKILGYKPTNDYIKSTSDDLNKKYILVIGDSHAHTSYAGLEQELGEKYELLLFANSGCQPLINGARGTLKTINTCKEKIDSIYLFINKFKDNISKIIYIARGPKPMYNLGFGEIDDGKVEAYYEEYFLNRQNGYSHENIHKKKLDETLNFYNSQNIEFYFLLENPELGFSPKECLERPFNFLNKKTNNVEDICKLPIEKYMDRSKGYRDFVFELSRKYKNINVVDPLNVYCDDKYCYAIRNGKILYADDDHHSLDGSIEQAKYLKNYILK